MPSLGESSRMSLFSSAELAEVRTVGDDGVIVQIDKPRK
jgi:hypothetical protein